MSKIIIKYTPVFSANLKAYESKQYRVIANQGSTRSSKTYSICQLLIKIALEEKKEISVVSPSLPHLKRGARKDIIEILNNMGVYNDNDFNKTDNIYRFKNGSYIEFFGADETTKLRGPGRDILYINEANLLPVESYHQLSWRTKDLVFIDFNPADEYSWVYPVADAEENKLIHSTYKNNLVNLTKSQIQDIESLQFADLNMWKVFGLGLRGTSTSTIYTHYKMCERLPDTTDVCYGLDFGFNHPSALIKVAFQDNNIYAEELLYENNLTNFDLSTRIKQLGLNKYDVIYCDSARPESIEELKRAGLNARIAQKQVLEGISMVKSFPLFITRNSTNLLKEIRNYKWKTNNDGVELKDPVKFMDDACDALRYAVYTKLHNPIKKFNDAIY